MNIVLIVLFAGAVIQGTLLGIAHGLCVAVAERAPREILALPDDEAYRLLRAHSKLARVGFAWYRAAHWYHYPLYHLYLWYTAHGRGGQ